MIAPPQEVYSYYPGCSLHGTALDYDRSVQEVCSKLGIELVEIPDWNCCGSSSTHSIDSDLALSLAARVSGGDRLLVGRAPQGR